MLTHCNDDDAVKRKKSRFKAGSDTPRQLKNKGTEHNMVLSGIF